jgi:Leucine-rich repeat (LRR) protein
MVYLPIDADFGAIGYEQITRSEDLRSIPACVSQWCCCSLVVNVNTHVSFSFAISFFHSVQSNTSGDLSKRREIKHKRTNCELYVYTEILIRIYTNVDRSDPIRFSISVLSLSARSVDSFTADETLDLSDRNFSSLSTVSQLRGSPTFSLIKLKKNQFSRIPKSSLSGCTSLKYLDISENQLSRLDVLDRHPELVILDISRNRVCKLENLEANQSLRRLLAAHNLIQQVRFTRPMPNLIVLDLRYNQITKIDFAKFCPNLNELYLDRCSLNSIHGLEGFSKLITFTGRENAICDRDVINQPFVETVDVSFNKLSVLSPFYGMTGMIRLDISSNIVNDEGLSSPVAMLNLLSFKASNTRISRPSLLLRLFPNVELVDLSQTEVNSLDDVHNFIRGATNLRLLDLRQTPLTTHIYPIHRETLWPSIFAYNKANPKWSSERNSFRRSILKCSHGTIEILDGINVTEEEVSGESGGDCEPNSSECEDYPDEEVNVQDMGVQTDECTIANNHLQEEEEDECLVEDMWVQTDPVNQVIHEDASVQIDESRQTASTMCDIGNDAAAVAESRIRSLLEEVDFYRRMLCDRIHIGVQSTDGIGQLNFDRFDGFTVCAQSVRTTLSLNAFDVFGAQPSQTVEVKGKVVSLSVCESSAWNVDIPLDDRCHRCESMESKESERLSRLLKCEVSSSTDIPDVIESKPALAEIGTFPASYEVRLGFERVIIFSCPPKERMTLSLKRDPIFSRTGTVSEHESHASVSFDTSSVDIHTQTKLSGSKFGFEHRAKLYDGRRLNHIVNHKVKEWQFRHKEFEVTFNQIRTLRGVTVRPIHNWIN